MIFILTKSWHNNYHYFWEKMPDIFFGRLGEMHCIGKAGNDEIVMFEMQKIFPKLVIKNGVMEKIEVIEHEDGYFIRKVL